MSAVGGTVRGEVKPMPESSVILCAVMALLIATAFLPERFRFPLMATATLLAGSFVLIDMAFPWQAVLVWWLALVALVVWAWRRDVRRRGAQLDAEVAPQS